MSGKKQQQRRRASTTSDLASFYATAAVSPTCAATTPTSSPQIMSRKGSGSDKKKKKKKERNSDSSNDNIYNDRIRRRSNSLTYVTSHTYTPPTPSLHSSSCLSSPTSSSPSSSSFQWSSTPPAQSSKVTYPNEGVYEGPISPNRKRHGIGMFRDSKGNQFRGRWENDKPNGIGIKIFAGGDRFEGGYVDGKRSGRGIYLYSNGDKYSGCYSEGRMNGYGCFTWASGDSYRGEWCNDQMHGEGIKTFADGSFLSGKFHHGTAYGVCEHKYPGGEVYRGSYVAELRDGYGVYEWADGSFYRGGWSKDRMSGQAFWVTNIGERILSRENSLLGDSAIDSDDNHAQVSLEYDSSDNDYNNNNDINAVYSDASNSAEVSGDEIRESSNVTSGSSGSNSSNNIYPLTSHREISGFDPRYHDVVLQYHGDMKDGQFHGYGCVIYGDGSKYEGEFKKGVYHGWGVHMNAIDMDIYEGEFVDGRKQGKGLIYYAGLFADNSSEQLEVERRRLENLFEAFNLAEKDLDFNLKNLASYGELSESYQGDWINDRPEGLGVKIYESGFVYMGSFVNGMRDGQGMMYSVPETISTEIGDFNARGGIWEENSLIISQPNVFNCHQNSQRGSKIIPL